MDADTRTLDQRENSLAEQTVIAEAGSQRSCLFLDTFYDRFLTHLYHTEPALRTETFAVQLSRLLSTNNGDSDFYATGLRAHGWRCEQLVINSPFMQAAWAREHGINASGTSLLIEQVARINPDVLYCQDMHQLSEPLLRELKKHCRLLVGQIATSPLAVPLHCYDVVVSSIFPLVEHCRSRGITSLYIPLAFAPRVSEGLSLQSDFMTRPIECSFAGSVASDIHLSRVKLLSSLAQSTPIQVWGTGAELLPQDSPLRARYRGEAWGQDLFTVLGNSKITVNAHAEVLFNKEKPVNATETWANNMRLFEATGMGALLITEYRDNLGDLFEIGREVVAYRSDDECAALVRYYTRRPQEAREIALAGQERTLRDHSYDSRMRDLSNRLRNILALSTESHRPIDYNTISYDFSAVSPSEVRVEHTEAWKSAALPLKQRALVTHELKAMYRGEKVIPFASLKEVLARTLFAGDTVLEIGCSSGYYSEVLSYLIPKPFSYSGVDYSEAMIEMARTRYPTTPFEVASGDDLPYTDRAFDLVISGGVLLHCPNYAEHIEETARVTKRSIVLARTPVSKLGATRFFTKKAYGVETVELVFNEAEIVNLVKAHGFSLTHYLVLDSDPARDTQTVTYAFTRSDA